MGFKLFNDGASIRIENGTKILFLAKDQVKTIDTIQDNIVRIDIGEGPLKNIFINYQDVETPVMQSANELRDLINQMLLSDAYDGGDAKEVTQVSILSKLGDIATILANIQQKESDFTQTEPSRTDESNPYIIYRGWHKGYGFVDVNEWAIERVRRESDEIVREWVSGSQNQDFAWTERLNYQYYPFGHGLPNQ